MPPHPARNRSSSRSSSSGARSSGSTTPRTEGNGLVLASTRMTGWLIRERSDGPSPARSTSSTTTVGSCPRHRGHRLLRWRRRLPVPQRPREDGRSPRCPRLEHDRRHRVPRHRGLVVPHRPQGVHDHLGRSEHLPQEAETVLVLHPKVADVAAIGTPNEEMGKEVKAVVQPVEWDEAGPELEVELIAYCRDRLAHYKCPRTVDSIGPSPGTRRASCTSASSRTATGRGPPGPAKVRISKSCRSNEGTRQAQSGQPLRSSSSVPDRSGQCAYPLDLRSRSCSGFVHFHSTTSPRMARQSSSRTALRRCVEKQLSPPGRARRPSRAPAGTSPEAISTQVGPRRPRDRPGQHWASR